MKMNITPGKWKLGNSGAIYTDDLRVMIAEVIGLDLGIRPDEALANAHAISLLPDMIEALRDFITHYAGPKREQLGNGYAYQWYTRANNLLKRIEG